MNRSLSLVLAGFLLVGLPAVGRGQRVAANSGQLPAGKSFGLSILQQAAIDTDPRMQQFALLTTQTDLRLRNISAERRPSVTVQSFAQYQSDVAHLPPSA